MDKVVETFDKATSKPKQCKGENCHAIDGFGHSEECKQEHSKVVNRASKIVPICFDRAESGGRVFDNCRFYNDCKEVHPACFNNPDD